MKIFLTALSLVCTASPAFCRSSVQEEVWIDCGDSRIYGVLSSPDSDSGNMPLAIISHGFNGTHEFGKNYFGPLNELGYKCFSFDFPCGSVGSRSGSDTMNMSIIDEQQALEAVISYFKGRSDIDNDKVVLIGESQGGLVSALVAADKDNDVDKLILIYPALCIPDNWNERYRKIGDIPERTTLWNVDLGRRFFTELRYMDVFNIIGGYDGPVLIIHGDQDPVVPIRYAEKADSCYTDSRLQVIEGAGHGFKPEEFDKSVALIRDFLIEQD